ncbi:MAG: xylulokinase [Anaerolineae bacterium]|nr:xylulokinase [Anaerolineae bacterium]
MTFLLGIDVSTTATKALLLDAAGNVAGTETTPYDFQTPQPLWSEQDPALWWQGTCHSIRRLLDNTGIDGSAVAGIGLTGQMHGLVLLDKQGSVLRPAILWNDQRTGAQCDEIRERVGRERLIQITGNDALTGFTAPKILWVREHDPEIYARVRHILLPKDYVRYRLSSDFALDRAGGAGTGLFDLAQRSWSEEILQALEIPRAYLPPTYEGPQITGRVNATAATEIGLQPGTPIVGGGGDQAAQAVGVGAVEAGIVALTLGTSGVVFATTEAPLVEPDGRLHAFCHALPGRWHFMGVMLSAAGSLQWYRDTLAPGVPFDELVQEAAAIAPGSEGLFFLPYLTGERTPHPDPLARAGWVGLTVRHRRPHLTRAVLEGVAFGLKDSFRLIQEAGRGAIRQVRISGGGAKSPLWRQILADVLDVPLVTVNTTEGAAYGAALLAGAGVGVYDGVEEACRKTIRTTGETRPGAEATRYLPYYERYRALYPALASHFKATATLP